MTTTLTHLQALESEAIHIMREAVAQFEKPVLLYSIGKDSSVMLHLARKAFWPALPPFPLLHVDTTWKFREMIAFRDRRAAELGLTLIVHTNAEGLAAGVTPFIHGSTVYTDVMKTEALKQALDQTASTPLSAARGATRKRAGPRNACSRCAAPATAGIRRRSARNCGACSTAASSPAKACASFRSPTGPNSTCGTTSPPRT
jgi:3'-phosphoadenosine 5'-phosphosulfate sulfotransferase (PAPS reductase)/FAD synthetase